MRRNLAILVFVLAGCGPSKGASGPGGGGGGGIDTSKPEPEQRCDALAIAVKAAQGNFKDDAPAMPGAKKAGSKEGKWTATFESASYPYAQIHEEIVGCEVMGEFELLDEPLDMDGDGAIDDAAWESPAGVTVALSTTDKETFDLTVFSP